MPRFSLKVVFLALMGIVLVIGIVALVRPRENSSDAIAIPGADAAVLHLARQLGEIQERERQVARTAWAQEILAQEYGGYVDAFWDELNRATNKAGALASVSFEELRVPGWDAPRMAGPSVFVHDPGEFESWNSAQWRQFLQSWAQSGWILEQTEFRHNRFEPGNSEVARSSRFYFSAHLSHSENAERAILEGDLVISWSKEPKPRIEGIDASKLVLKTRRGEPAFRLLFQAALEPPRKSFFIDPLIVYDLDGDGISEVILAAKNLVYRGDANGNYAAHPLCLHPQELVSTAVIADFDGDGTPDFLCASREGLFLYRGSPAGTFETAGELVWAAEPGLQFAQALTAGDIDQDGDLDIWLAQYKVPYAGGQMPTPYFDANDGYPSYLLLNDGAGKFTDATEAAGLAAKRWRRTYTASFADLNNDGHLDLMVISDFAGLDLYLNNGQGQFRDVTSSWVPESKALGMAHAWSDFNRDGLLDLLMIGMNSPTADRLEHLGLSRPGRKQQDRMRASLTFGNRLYLGTSSGFKQTALSDSIARTGWSWGVAAFDFDRDGWPDVYIANGHETKESVREYEPEFWLHDIYVGNSRESLLASAYFGEKYTRTRARGYSYGGYEKNRFLLNVRGEEFLEIGHLMGVASQEDSRNVVADDLDGDGRLDLLVTTFEVWPENKQTLRIYKNVLENEANWIGFRLREEGKGISPVGARVTLRHSGGVQTRQIITGDSYRSQHANTVFFGLGPIREVDEVEVRWINGRSARVERPVVNEYHWIQLEPK